MANPRALILISSDPRTSPRPAEAIRIAAGVGAWKRVEVSLYLRGAAVLALSEFSEEFVDADHYARYLPLAGEWGRPIYVQQNAPELAEIGQSPLAYQEVTDVELAKLVAGNDYVLRF